ncbi:MAG: recombinase family protein [Chloroflexota bacterium]
MAKRKVQWMIFPTIDRCTREPLHLGEFERKCRVVAVKWWYCDAVDNSDTVTGAMMRQLQVSMAKKTLETIRTNNLEGRIGIALQDMPPPGAAPFGYSYRSVLNKKGSVNESWLELEQAQADAPFPLAPDSIDNEQDLDKYFVTGTSLHTAMTIVYLSAKRGYSQPEIVKALNERGIPAPKGGLWQGSTIASILRNTAYYGYRYYNKSHFVANPDRGWATDATSAERKTLRRNKPEEEWNKYTCPTVLTEDWKTLIDSTRNRHRTRHGASEPTVPMLLRGLVICPVCGHAMVYRRKNANRSGNRTTYYYCIYNKAYRTGECAFKTYVRGNESEETVRANLRKLLGKPGLMTEVLDELRRKHNNDAAGSLKAQVTHWERQVRDAERKLKALQDLQLESDNPLFTPEEIRERARVERERMSDAIRMLTKATQAYSNHQHMNDNLDKLADAVRKAGEVDLYDFALCRSLLELLQVAFVPELDGRGGGDVIVFYPGHSDLSMLRIRDMGLDELKIAERVRQAQNGVDHEHQVSTRYLWLTHFSQVISGLELPPLPL